MAVTVIVPCRNEAGHLVELFSEIMSSLRVNDYVVCVEGGSTDNTWEKVQELASHYSDRILAIQQNGKGKFDAVLSAIPYINTEYVFIWDADGTVPVRNNLRILEAAYSPDRVVVVGDRLRGRREKGSMQFANFIANWLFAIVWAPILRCRPTDMLCGSKLFPSEVLKNVPEWLRSADPYGDFALLATARKQRINVLSQAVDYTARRYGETNIHRWRGGAHLTKITLAVYRDTIRGRRYRAR